MVALAAHGDAGDLPLSPFAHDGPPYPILVDERVAARTLSVWADPDVGEGTFYLYVEDANARPMPASAVRICVQPSDGRLPEACEAAEPAPEGAPYQHMALVPFDRRGPWRVRFLIDSPEGSGEVATEVEVTPPGLGKIDLLWFVLPFLVFGLIWAKAFLARREGPPGRSGQAPGPPTGRERPPGSPPPRGIV